MLVKYQGGYSDHDLSQIAQNWQESLTAPNGSPCGSATLQPTHAGIYVDVDPASCVNLYGNQPNWHLSLSYFDRGTSAQHSFLYQLDGTPPGYIPCEVSASNFSAAWDDGSDPDNPTVTVDYSKNGDQLDGCANWQYTIVKDGAFGCGSAEPNGGSPDRGNGQTTVQSTCNTQVLGLSFQVRVDFTRPDGSSDSRAVADVASAYPTPNVMPAPAAATATGRVLE